MHSNYMQFMYTHIHLYIYIYITILKLIPIDVSTKHIFVSSKKLIKHKLEFN